MKGKLKKSIGAALCVLLSLLLGGCSMLGGGDEERIAVEFTVVEADDVPAELQEIIESHKKEEIKMTFEAEDGRYLVRGYGEQPTGGYSISADLVELGKDGLHVITTLIPPSQDQNPAQEPSYPCIVLKVANEEQEVIFE